MKRVAIGSSDYHDYAWYMPITCMFWRRVVGYEPIALLVGDEASWKATRRNSLVIEALKHHEIPTHFIGFIEGAEVSTISQLARHHAAALDFPESDILIPSDADLWPLTRDFYHQHDPSRHAIGLYYSNGYGSKEHFPTCHQSMIVGTWREVMGISPATTVAQALRRAFSEGNLSSKKGLDVWFFDEHWSSKKIRESKYFPAQVHFIERQGQPPRDRIDRSAWPEFPRAEGMTDAHLLRPGYTEANWRRTRPLVYDLLRELLPWADNYAMEYRAVMKA